MAQKYSNVARADLAAGISGVETNVTVNAGGSLFPVANGTDWFNAVLQDGDGIEIVRVTGHTAGSNSFTVLRGQDGTTARPFAMGAVFAQRIVASDMEAASNAIPEHLAAVDPHPQYTTAAEAAAAAPVQSVAGKSGAVTLVKADVGLGSVDNVSAASLRDRTTHTGAQAISTVTGLQTALDGKLATTDASVTNAREWTAATVSQVDAEAGTSTSRFAFTPQRVFQAVAAWWNASASKTKLDGIEASANNYVHPTSGVAASTYRSVTVNTLGHVTAGTNPTTLAGYGITDAAPSTHVGATGVAHGAATTSVNGFMSSADKAKLDGIASGAQVNVATNLAQGTRTTTAVPVTSSTGTSATLDAATTSLAGVMTSADKTKLDGIAAGAQVNVATNLGYTTAASSGTVTSSTGTNATVPAATTTLAGLLTGADKIKLDGIAAGAQVNAVTSVASKTGAVTLVKDDVGLSLVDNTADSSKSVASAATLTTARTINGVSFNGSANITVADGTKLPLAGGTMTGGITFAAGQTWPTFNQNTTGNAGTVTNGVYTTGDQTIGGNKSYTGMQTTIRNGTNTVGSIFGSGQWELNNAGTGGCIMTFHRAAQYAINMGLDADNVFRLGGWSNGENIFRWQSDTNGNFTAQGNVTAFSDERLKRDWQDMPGDFIERVAEAKSGTYTRIDSKGRQAGSSAQDWLKLLPEVVAEDASGNLSLAYGNAALVTAIELAKQVVMLKARVEALEGR